MKLKTTFLILAFNVLVISLVGCKKNDSAASIVGTWNANSEEDIQSIGNVFIYDDTYNSYYSTMPATITFTSDGYYSSSLFPVGYSVKYLVSNDTLYIMNQTGTTSFQLSTLTTHSLSEKTIYNSGTVPDTMNTTIYSYTR